MKKIWCIHARAFYVAVTKNEIMTSAGKWPELEIITLSEIGQIQKQNSACFPFNEEPELKITNVRVYMIHE